MRSRVEWTLRAALLGALAFAIWLAIHTLRERQAARARGGPAAVRAALGRWSTIETPVRAHVVFDSVPTADVRDWLAALRDAGTQISWEGVTLKPTAIAVEPVVDPKRPLRIWIAAPPQSRIAVTDSLGVIDSVATRSGGAVLTVAQVDGAVHASVGGTIASAARHDSILVRPVLVLGVASWEGKFIMASLEEHGWRVDGRFALAPTGDVVQGASAASVTIDTSRYSAVIALDSSAAKYAARIAEFVRRGGGFIATGEAASLSAFAALLPASPSAVRPEAPFDIDSTRPRHALALTLLDQLKRDAVAVERMDAGVAVAARRVGRGRVLQVGYLNTWRWRMGGPDDPVRAYRSWWSAMVSSVAYAPRSALVASAPVDPTPLATLVGTLGSATPRAAEPPKLLADPRLLTALFVVILGALLLETASRRLRGRP